MSRTHLIIPDQHAHWEHDNHRAYLIGHLINDIHPDVIINMGDAADFPSLSSYDKGQRNFVGRTYRADIDSHLDFQDKLWSTVRRRHRRLPFRVFLEGNHEHRIERALSLSPELQDTISLRDMDLESHYDFIVRYNGNTPGTISIDGVTYAHYFITGISGKPLEGEHHAATLLTKNFISCTASHTHKLDYSTRTDANGRRICGLVAGSYLDYPADWAGEINKLWWNGVVVCKDVEDGGYDLNCFSIEALENEYGTRDR